MKKYSVVTKWEGHEKEGFERAEPVSKESYYDTVVEAYIHYEQARLSDEWDVGMLLNWETGETLAFFHAVMTNGKPHYITKVSDNLFS